MNKDLISVIIPIYNVREYLIECIESVVNQTYRNIEIILLDDGSTDGCAAICDDYQKKDNRVKVIHKKNGGLSDARNVGIELAMGKYITFVDSDDFIESNMIEYLYSLLNKFHADLSCCQRKSVDESGREIIDKVYYQDQVIDGNFRCMKEFFTNEALDTVAWGKLYQLSMFHEIRYPNEKYHEDIFTTYKIIAKCNRLAVGNERKYCYRLRETSISKSSFQVKHLDAIKGNMERAEFIRKNYPVLLGYANAGIIYATNQCVLKLAETGGDIVENGKPVDQKKIVKQLQKYYRRYEKDFLKGNSGALAKIFSIAAYINLNLLIKLLRIKHGKQ